MKDDLALTPLEVAEILKISKNTVYELIKRGELNGYKVGKKVRIDAKDLEEYKKKTKNNPEIGDEEAHRGGFIISGQDIMLDILVSHFEKTHNGLQVLRSHEGSYNGLYELYQGRVQIATAHLWDGDTGEYNVPYIKRMLPGVPAVIVRLAERMQGFYIAGGNPKNIKGWEDLKRKDIAIANREKGSGTRVLLDEHLRKLGINPLNIRGYDKEYSSHLAIASAISRGEADIGMGNEKSSLQVKDIDFIPLQREKYDMIIKKEDINKQNFKALLEVVNSEEFKLELEGIGGYYLSEIGKIVAET